MLALSLFIKNIFGWAVAHWRIAAGAACMLVLVIVFGLVFRSCNKPPKLDQKEIQQAQKAIEENDRRVMVEILANSSVREQGIDSNIKQAEEATEKSPRFGWQGRFKSSLKRAMARASHGGRCCSGTNR